MAPEPTENPASPLAASNPDDLQGHLDRRLIDVALEDAFEAHERVAVIVDLNFGFAGTHPPADASDWQNGLERKVGTEAAKAWVCRWLAEMKLNGADDIVVRNLRYTPRYVFAELSKSEVAELLEIDRKASAWICPRPFETSREGLEAFNEALRTGFDETEPLSEFELRPFRAIYKIWLDHPVEPHITRTMSTIKADAARIAFGARGEGITWAVVDSGIHGEHSHFERYENLVLPPPLAHQDFTREDPELKPGESPIDESGHGTHVAGIIAGSGLVREEGEQLTSARREHDSEGNVTFQSETIRWIAGVAPRTKIVSLRIFDRADTDAKANLAGRGGRVSNLMSALGYIDWVNEGGRNLRIHGVNLSVGYPFDPTWFGCGQSPLCVEVDRLVCHGVVVVVAAGNSGYGTISPKSGGQNMATLTQTINDPGNSKLAITVGSTHRFMPHAYGISYFSSKGPTGDGRIKPDLVAPGEGVISCAAGRAKQSIEDGIKAIRTTRPERAGSLPASFQYLEMSGTSMAAPHVSGAIAAFLSIRREFIGRPAEVKQILLDSATDLGRDRYFQGHGLLDLMRAIQSV